MKLTRSLLASLVLGTVSVPALVACSGGGGGGGGGALKFHGESDVIPGFSFDTGLQPASSPVQLQLQLSATGKTTIDAEADQGGPSSAPTVVGRAQSGALTVDGHFKLVGRLKVDLSGVKYDGPIPQLTNVDIAFGGQSPFDPFLLGGAQPATVTADIPPTDLPPIPLPGGLTGSLVLSVDAGSTVTSTFTGVCAGVSNKKVQYIGSAGTTGTLALKAKIVVKVPIVGDKTFDLPKFSVPMPTATHDVDLGTLDLSADGSPVSGPVAATATQGSCGGGPSGDGGSTGEGGTTTNDGGAPDSSGTAYVAHPDLVWYGPEAFYDADGGATVEHCQSLCDAISGCVSFATDGVQCGGISSFAEPYHYPGATTYVRADQAIAKYLTDVGIDHNGADIASKSGMDQESCAAWCDATTGCVGFTFSTNPIDNNTCWLKSAWTTSSSFPDRQSFCLPTTSGCVGW